MSKLFSIPQSQLTGGLWEHPFHSGLNATWGTGRTKPKLFYLGEKSDYSPQSTGLELRYLEQQPHMATGKFI